MTQRTTRYCADPEALAALRRDGMGWGHDLDCGCYYADRVPRSAGRFARLLNAFKRTS